MGALFVIGCHPFVDDFADCTEGGERVRIEDLAPEGPVSRERLACDGLGWIGLSAGVSVWRGTLCSGLLAGGGTDDGAGGTMKRRAMG